MNFTDFLRQAMAVKGDTLVSIRKLDDGRYEASRQNRDGSRHVEVHADPVDALWNSMVPWVMRRPPPASLTAGPEPWYLKSTRKKAVESDLDDLLGPSTTGTPRNDLDDLLG